MRERDQLFLGHILAAITDIECFTAEGKVAFMADRKTQSAVLRQLEIIGEAVKNLGPATTASAPTVPWRAIAGTPVRLIRASFTPTSASTWMRSGQWLSRICQRCAPRFNALPLADGWLKAAHRLVPVG